MRNGLEPRRFRKRVNPHSLRQPSTPLDIRLEDVYSPQVQKFRKGVATVVVLPSPNVPSAAVIRTHKRLP